MRPKPVITSSKIRRMPCWSQIFAQALEIADRRRQHAAGAGHRLDDDGGDGRWIVDLQSSRQFVGEMHAPVPADRARTPHARDVVGVRQMVDFRQQRAEIAAMAADAAHREPSPAHAMIGLGAADEANAARFAARAVIAARDLQRGINGLGTGIGEEDMVEPRRRDIAQAGRPARTRPDGSSGTKRRSRARRLCLDRLDNAPLSVAGIDTPQPRHARRECAGRPDVT